MVFDLIYERHSEPIVQPRQIQYRYERGPSPGKQMLMLGLGRPAFYWIYTFSGAGIYERNGLQTEIGEGNAFWYLGPDPGTLIHPATKQDHWSHLWISFSGDPEMAIYRHITEHHGRMAMLEKTCDAVRSCVAIYQSALGGKPMDSFKWSAMGYQFMLDWYRDMEGLGSTVVGTSNSGGILPMSLATANFKELAKKTGYSRSHLSRLLKEAWNGYTPGKVLRTSKMNEAMRLLRDTNLQVSQISRMVGYARAASFSAAFRRETNQRPLDYRHAFRLHGVGLDKVEVSPKSRGILIPAQSSKQLLKSKKGKPKKMV